MDYCLSVSQPVGHSLSLSLSLSLYLSISVRFNASTRIFINTSPFLYILDFIGAKDDRDGGDNWSCAKLQSNRHVQLFTDQMSFMLLNQQCRST